MRLWRTQILYHVEWYFCFICAILYKNNEVIFMGKSMYCEKCGHVGGVLFRKKCRFCGTKMKILSEEMKQKYNIFYGDWFTLLSELCMFDTKEGERRRIEELLSRESDFIMNEVANNPLFSMEDYEKQVQNDRESFYSISQYHKNQILERQAKNLARMQKEKDKQDCIPRCPICGSTNINKIALGSRAVKTAVFGVVGAVDDTGKTYRCDNCGSKF